MSDDRLDKARQRGDGPRAPAFVAFGVVALGLAGGGLGASVTPWRALATAGFGLNSSTYALLTPVILPTLLGGALGALAGAVLAHLLLDRFEPALRLRIHRDRERSTGLVGLLAIALAALCLPTLLAVPGGRDPGFLLLFAPLLALGAALLFALPLAILSRARGRTLWRERVAPDPPPRRAPDEASPEVRATIAALGKEGQAPGGKL